MAGKVFDSYRAHLPKGYELRQIQDFVLTESVLFQASQQAWKLAGDAIDHVRVNEGSVDWNIGMKIATLEMAAFVFQYPQFIIFARYTPSLYRLLRGAELSGVFKRGGQTTLIGSGITIPEVLATYVVPPSRDMIQELNNHGTLEGLTRRLDQALKLQRSPLEPPLNFLSGNVTAIEPDEKWFKEGVRDNQDIFHMPNKIDFHSITLEKALRKHRIPQSDTIVLNRVDPRIFGSTKSDWARTLDEILLHIKNGGYFVLTVGSGNVSHKDYEKNLRLDMLKWLSEILPDRGIQIVTPGGKAYLVEGRDDIAYYGGPYGMIGYIIARK